MKKIAVLFSLIFLALASCKKEDQKGPSKDVLINHTWRADALYINETDQNIPACLRDDLWKFQPDGSFIFDEGVNKCNPLNPQTNGGQWSLSGSSLTLSAAGGSSLYTISYLDDQRLELQQTVSTGTQRLVFYAQ